MFAHHSALSRSTSTPASSIPGECPIQVCSFIIFLLFYLFCVLLCLETQILCIVLQWPVVFRPSNVGAGAIGAGGHARWTRCVAGCHLGLYSVTTFTQR